MSFGDPLLKQTSNFLFSCRASLAKTFRDISCDFVDRIIVATKATIHESTRSDTKYFPQVLVATERGAVSSVVMILHHCGHRFSRGLHTKGLFLA
jgi:hypothetical protein